MDFVLIGPATQIGLDAAMASVGFARTGDRYLHPGLAFYVEFPRGPLAIGADYQIRPVIHSARAGRTLALSAADSCRDRLAAFYHWNDRQSLRVAAWIATAQRVQLAEVRRWSRAEGFPDRFDEFLDEVRRLRARRRQRREPADWSSPRKRRRGERGPETTGS